MKLNAILTSFMCTAAVFLTPAQAQQADISEAMSKVTTVSQGLQATVADLQTSISASANSAEEGTRLLDEMLAAATDVNDSLNKDSEVWQEINALLAQWSEKRDQLLIEAQEDEALKEVAELWQQRVDQGMALRTQIIDQASTSSNLVDDIRAKRRLILAYYEVEAADQVLANMQSISDQLGEMNTQMQAMLDTAGVEPSELGVSQ